MKRSEGWVYTRADGGTLPVLRKGKGMVGSRKKKKVTVMPEGGTSKKKRPVS